MDFCLLFITSVLTLQSINVQDDFNESKTLAKMTYSQCLFLLLRIGIILLTNRKLLPENYRAVIISILISLDIVSTTVIYFGPKLYDASQSVEKGSMNLAKGSTFVAGNNPIRVHGRTSVDSWMNAFGIKASDHEDTTSMKSIMNLRKSGVYTIKPKDLKSLRALNGES